MPLQTKQGLIPVLGLDTSKPGMYIDDRATPRCRNVIIDRSLIRKRYGSKQLGTSLSERILAYKELYVGGVYSTLRIGLTKMESMTYSTGAWTDRSGGTPLTADSTAYRVDTCLPTISDSRVMVFTNFKDVPKKWGGTEVNLGGGGGVVVSLGDGDGTNPPKAKYCLNYGVYTLLANVNVGGNDFPMRVQWCNDNDPDTWNSGNAGNKDLKEDGNDITALALYGNYVCVHKKTCIYLGYLIPSSYIFDWERRATGVGTCCFATIQNLPTGEQIFLAEDGVYLFNGTVARLITSPVVEELKAILNTKEVHKCWSVVSRERDEYWLAVPTGGSTEPNTVYKYNYLTGQCHMDDRTDISAVGLYTTSQQMTWDEMTMTWDELALAWDSALASQDFQNIIYGSNAGVSSKRMPIHNDISTAIDAYWDSKDYVVEPGRLGRWQELEFWAKGNSVEVYYSTDSGLSWNYIETKTLTSAMPSDDSPLISYFDVVSSKIRFRFRNATASETFYLQQFISYYLPREMRK